MLLDSAYMLQI
jgi:hypothetical protein